MDKALAELQAQRQQESEFFEWYDKIQALAEQYNTEFRMVVNTRQTWDAGYSSGYLAGLRSAMESLTNPQSLS